MSGDVEDNLLTLLGLGRLKVFAYDLPPHPKQIQQAAAEGSFCWSELETNPFGMQNRMTHLSRPDKFIPN